MMSVQSYNSMSTSKKLIPSLVTNLSQTLHFNRICFVKEVCLLLALILVLYCPVNAEKLNKHVENRNPRRKYESKSALANEEQIKNEVPMEKDPHFLVWKIISKVFILTVLRATRRFWYPTYGIFGFCYGLYMMITLALWLKICFDNLMEYMLVDWEASRWL